MAMNIGRNMDFRKGTSQNTDMLSVNNSQTKADDKNVEKMRQKVGAEFTGDLGRATGKKKNEMGKDDFMKLMSAQLKYQDPVSPMKNEEMAAQLAQFSALEQMMNVNNTLEKMVSGQKPSEHMLAASLIGKRISTDSTHFEYQKGTSPEIAFKLPENAKSVSLSIVNAKGEVVRELDLGELQQGDQSVRWDGKNAKYQDEPLGEYSYRVSALDKSGKPIQIGNESSGLVTGVTFEGGKSVLLVGDKKVAVERVSRIEQDSASKKDIPPTVGKAAAPLAKSLAPPAEGGIDQASVKPSATDGKQKNSISENENLLAQYAKNNLPSDLPAEKMKSMDAGMEVPDGTSAGTKTVDPLWNPDTN